MKHLGFYLFFLLLSLQCAGQTGRDSIPTDTSDTFLYPWEFEPEEKDSAGKLILYQIGGGICDGNTQYFEGFNNLLMYNNASSGLPVYSDWDVYSNEVLIPKYFSAELYISFMASVRNLKTRLGAFFYKRSDSLAYVSGFAINDTIFGRQGIEHAYFGGVSGAAMITTRKLLHFFRLYGGASLEIGVSPTSKIGFLEYSLDFGEQRILELNEFRATGKPRLDFYGSAILGVETCFASKFGFSFEGLTFVYYFKFS